ncbi:MAG: nucleotidyl transferase AbiEii/AbiGii toxin family protein [Verrucomicrobiota bacterium]|nr:nucleotidyl transferase AbiEii/AbiGii toxin family protein [Verrucomicrobiota bacterium]
MSRYQTPSALRRALEDRLLAAVRREGGDIQRMRRQAAFDRLLCRLFHEPNAPWLLKGGYAMELRIQKARTTRDVDLAIRQLPDGAEVWNDAAVRASLERAAAVDLQDGFEFTIGEPTMDLDAAPYGGARYPVEAQMAGRRFANFHLDVSAGDVLREPFEILEGQDWLGFAGIAKAKLPAISREEQFAEKLHAYTLPRTGRPNTRVKDLVDMLLLLDSGTLDRTRLVDSIIATFSRRGTHPVPSFLPEPLLSWRGPFGELAAECGMDGNMAEHHRRLAAFLGEFK